jgi:pyrroloquinoline quinone biosynthesis protein B
MLTIRVLGAAAGGGFPQWNANSVACRRARQADPAAPAATQASIALTANERDWIVVNASPDLRQQIEANPPLHPAGGLRSSPITAVILTNGDVDAVAGLLHLREETFFGLYAERRVLEILSANPIFSVLDAGLVPHRALRVSEWQPILKADGTATGLEVRPFPVPGKIPLYLEDGAEDAGSLEAGASTIGLEIRAGGSRFFYVANCACLSDDLVEQIADAPLLFFDGTLFTDDEMIRQGVGRKTGRRMGHMSLDGPDGSLVRLGPLDIGRKIFIHINNTNPVLLRDSAERRRVEAAGFEVAYDGMEVRL